MVKSGCAVTIMRKYSMKKSSKYFTLRETKGRDREKEKKGKY
jgi:hypothetical protein